MKELMPKVARIYLRVSTDAQDLSRQERIVSDTKAAGYYVAGVYREKASGARPDRPELLRMISDLQPDEVVVAESMDRISRLPLKEAENLIEAIRATGARLAIPGVADLSEVAATMDGVPRIVVDAVQEMLLRVALQIARDDYESRRERQRQGITIAKKRGHYVNVGRKPQLNTHKRIIALRSSGYSIAETARLAGCGTTLVKRIWSQHKQESDQPMLPLKKPD